METGRSARRVPRHLSRSDFTAAPSLWAPVNYRRQSARRLGGGQSCYRGAYYVSAIDTQSPLSLFELCRSRRD
ncbi:hypothetical protein TNCV_1321161 [Trichonephila clavipes]|nr:hypothetical protein TNCV_1321161 [Trichonephila clavipes]